MCGVYRLKLLQNDRQFPDCFVINWIVQIRRKTDQAHYAALVGHIALRFSCLGGLFLKAHWVFSC
jgi:hypothetical protein